MRIKHIGVILAAMLSANGCMRHEQQANNPQDGSAGQTGTGTAQATTPPESGQPLNNLERANQLIGEQVLTADHLNTGKLDDFVIDQDSGRVLYAIVGIGGVLGVGETRLAVPPGVFIEAKKGAVQINADKNKLTNAPQIPPDIEKRPTADFLSKDYGYFGQKASWQGPSTAAASFNGARTASELRRMTVQNNTGQALGKIENVVLNVPAAARYTLSCRQVRT